MANFNEKFRIKTAQQSKKNKFSFVEDHITSSNFMQLLPLYKRLLVPGSSVRLTSEAFSRFNPLYSVSYGKVKFNLRSFFVPLRTCWHGWNEFITDAYAKGSSSVVGRVPYISNSTLVTWALTPAVSTYAKNAQGQSVGANGVPINQVGNYNYDFVTTGVIQDGNPTYVPRVFTAAGRQYYKILRSLGYDIFFPVFEESSAQSGVYTSVIPSYEFNALPFLSCCKACLDWYVPSQYSDTYYAIIGQFRAINSYGLTYVLLNQMLSIMAICYKPDYFTAAFDNPNTPNMSSGCGTVLFDVGKGYVDGDLLTSGSDSETVQNFEVTGDMTQSTQLTEPYASSVVDRNGRVKLHQFTLDTLESLSNYLKRNQLAGSRVIDRYLARYGYRLDDAKLDRSVYIDSSVSDVTFGTVFSQADTSDGVTGDYNGTAQMSNNGFSINYNTDEFGYLFVFGSYVPEISYVSGVDRDTLYSGKFDFFTPEQDSLGTQAISSSELFNSNSQFNMAQTWREIFQHVFGFTPRYSEYKVAKDRATGDFSLRSRSNELGAYFMSRNFTTTSFGNSVNSIVHSKTFVESGDRDQYSRLFYTQADTEDHIRMICRFTTELYAPMKQLYDVYDWERHNSDGRDVVVDVNGSKLD